MQTENDMLCRFKNTHPKKKKKKKRKTLKCGIRLHDDICNLTTSYVYQGVMEGNKLPEKNSIIAKCNKMTTLNISGNCERVFVGRMMNYSNKERRTVTV